MFAVAVGYILGNIAGSYLGALGVCASAITAIGKIYVGIVIAGALFELGWFIGTGHWIRQSNDLLPFQDVWALRLLYDWVYDIDGTFARIVVSSIFEKKLTYDLPIFANGSLEWYGDDYENS